MDETSGEEPTAIVSSTVGSTLAPLMNMTSNSHQDVANGLGWGLGMFTGIVLLIGVIFIVTRRRKIAYAEF
jgi:hypothetical protein